MSRKSPPFFTFFNFSSDVYNKFYIGLSRQHYPEDITHDDDQLSTKPHTTKTTRDQKISHTMMINYPRNPYDKNDSRSEDITHDDDQLSTKPIRRKRLKIKKMMVSWKQKKILRKKRVYSETSCVIFYI